MMDVCKCGLKILCKNADCYSLYFALTLVRLRQNVSSLLTIERLENVRARAIQRLNILGGTTPGRFTMPFRFTLTANWSRKIRHRHMAVYHKEKERTQPLYL